MVFVEPKSNFGFRSRRYGVLKAGKTAQRNGSPIYSNRRRPLTLGCGPMNADPTAFIVRRKGRVPAVFPSRNEPQIEEAVVCPVAIDVVNVIIRPLAVDNRPNYPVCAKEGVAKPARFVAKAIASKSFLPTVLSRELDVIGAIPPIQLPRFRLVAKQLAAKFWCDIGSVSHARSFRVWLGWRSGCTPFAARLDSRSAQKTQAILGVS